MGFSDMRRSKQVGGKSVSPQQGPLPSSASKTEPGFRFSGHQTFPLRIAWIPKAAQHIIAGNDPLTDVDEGITQLGLGKNMVEALRCWIEAFRIAERDSGVWQLTPIGKLIFHTETGQDPYFEDVTSAWVLHWLISTNKISPFFAWECLFNRWPAMEFGASQVIEAFEQESNRSQRPASAVTLRQHWEVFLHSYRPPRADKGEDHLDSAMSVLRLIQPFGERPNASGKWENVYAFDPSPRVAIPNQLFAFFIHNWWNENYPDEQTTPLRELVAGKHSPGRILKMQESEILHRISELASQQPKVFQIVESMNLRQLRRLTKSEGFSDLKAAYQVPSFI